MKCKSSSQRGLNRFPVNALQEASLCIPARQRNLFRPCIFSTIGTVCRHPWRPTWQCVLYIMQVMWSPQGKSSPDHPGLCSWASIQRHAPWSKPLPHNCILFSVTSPGGKKKIKHKIKLLVFLAPPPQHSNRGATGCAGEEAAAMGALCEHRLPAEPRPETRSQPAWLQGKGGERKKKAALSQSRKKGRPWAFPVVQLKQAKTSLHLHSLRVSADWGPKFSHSQCTARREVLEEKPAVALLLTAFSALA